MSTQMESTTAAWIERGSTYWGVSPDTYLAKLDAVNAFCAHVGLGPDALIDDCMTMLDDGRRVATMAAVRKYWKLVRSFGEQEGDDAAAAVMSFFIFNGVLMQCPGAEP